MGVLLVMEKCSGHSPRVWDDLIFIRANTGNIYTFVMSFCEKFLQRRYISLIRLFCQIKSIADSGAKVVVSGGKIGDMALHFLNKYGLKFRI